MNDQFIIYLVGCNRCASVRFFGASGRAYLFRWNDTFRAMTYEGRELTSQEFDNLAADIFSASAEQNVVRPVPKRLPGCNTPAPGSSLALPRFDSHAELLRVCAMLGKSEMEVARLTKINEGRGLNLAPEVNFDRSTPPPAESAPKAEFADYDPDDTAAPAPPPKASAIPTPPRPVPAMIPKLNPMPALQSGDFDPDEVPAGYEPAQS